MILSQRDLESADILQQLFGPASCDDGKHGRVAMAHPGNDYLIQSGADFSGNALQRVLSSISFRACILRGDRTIASSVCALHEDGVADHRYIFAIGNSPSGLH